MRLKERNEIERAIRHFQRVEKESWSVLSGDLEPRPGESVELHRDRGRRAELAVVALQRQIPREPSCVGGGYAYGRMVYDAWFCPHCGTRYEVGFDTYAYCWNCGQAINWKSEDWEDADWWGEE